jgi:hypothetical protein
MLLPTRIVRVRVDSRAEGSLRQKTAACNQGVPIPSIGRNPRDDFRVNHRGQVPPAVHHSVNFRHVQLPITTNAIDRRFKEQKKPGDNGLIVVERITIDSASGPTSGTSDARAILTRKT